MMPVNIISNCCLIKAFTILLYSLLTDELCVTDEILQLHKSSYKWTI